MDYSERLLRARIAEVPDGVYPAPDGWLEDDGKHWGKPLKIATTVVVKGSDILIDLSGSNEQVTTGFNCPFEGSVLPTANFAVRSCLLPESASGLGVPQNDGAFRPVHVYAPKGSIFNPTPPRGCEARFTQINRIPDQLMQALASVLPGAVTAGNSANVSCFVYSGESQEGGDDYWVTVEVNEGAYGGSLESDGLDAVDNLMANTRNNPVEEMELTAPLRCELYELQDASHGAGKWRGGIGARKIWRFLAETHASSTGDNRSIDPPRGLFGGASGRAGSITHIKASGERCSLPAKVSNHAFAEGDALEISLVSGAGYGDPFERDPALVLMDVKSGLLTVDGAREIYGVAVSSDGRSCDSEATHALRRSQSEQAL